MAGAPPLIFLIAGEASGDLIASRLMAELRRRTDGAVRFSGVGGPLMQEGGIESLFPFSELSLMGPVEIAPHVPRLLGRVRQTARAARAMQPAAVVTVDAPYFNFRVARKLAGAGFPLIHYVAPTVWAYRPGRANAVARFLDHVLCLFPFEPPYFEAVGLASTFVGHPLVEEPIGAASGPAFRARHGIGEQDLVLCALPGSRAGELHRHLPIFGETIRALAGRIGGLRLVIPTLMEHRATVAAAADSWGMPVVIVADKGEKYAAYAASDVALAASGTATLELALASVPMVVCYRTNPLTAAIARRVLRVPYLAMTNIVAGERLVPEFLQRACNARRLAAALEELLADEAGRRRQREGFSVVARRVGRGGALPSDRAAETVLRLIGVQSDPAFT